MCVCVAREPPKAKGGSSDYLVCIGVPGIGMYIVASKIPGPRSRIARGEGYIRHGLISAGSSEVATSISRVGCSTVL